MKRQVLNLITVLLAVAGCACLAQGASSSALNPDALIGTWIVNTTIRIPPRPVNEAALKTLIECAYRDIVEKLETHR